MQKTRSTESECTFQQDSQVTLINTKVQAALIEDRKIKSKGSLKGRSAKLLLVR